MLKSDQGSEKSSILNEFNFLQIFRQECRELIKMIPSVDKLTLLNGINQVKNRNKKFRHGPGMMSEQTQMILKRIAGDDDMD